MMYCAIGHTKVTFDMTYCAIGHTKWIGHAKFHFVMTYCAKGYTECKTLFETKVGIQNNMKTVLNRAITIENIDHIKEI